MILKWFVVYRNHMKSIWFLVVPNMTFMKLHKWQFTLSSPPKIEVPHSWCKLCMIMSLCTRRHKTSTDSSFKKKPARCPEFVSCTVDFWEKNCCLFQMSIFFWKSWLQKSKWPDIPIELKTNGLSIQWTEFQVPLLGLSPRSNSRWPEKRSEPGGTGSSDFKRNILHNYIHIMIYCAV